jgi:hypothetical protein
MTKTTITDLAYMVTGFLFIIALPISAALLINGFDLLSIAVFMACGFAFLSKHGGNADHWRQIINTSKRDTIKWLKHYQ